MPDQEVSLPWEVQIIRWDRWFVRCAKDYDQQVAERPAQTTFMCAFVDGESIRAVYITYRPTSLGGNTIFEQSSVDMDPIPVSSVNNATSLARSGREGSTTNADIAALRRNWATL